ncbi:MAG: hypothetical protein ACLQU2_03185 [Candidatus Binataceae bacterium]
MALICRKCNQPADDSRREYGQEMVRFIYIHRQPGQAPLEHSWTCESYCARIYLDEDELRRKEAP